MAGTHEGKLVLNSGAAAGDELYYKRWPVDKAKACVLIAHGYGEHLGRYEHVAAALNAAGYEVFAVDFWGHGKSDGVRGFAPAFSVYLDGIEALLSAAKSAAPGAKLFLLGHSMGGLVAEQFLEKRQQEFAGAVLSGPAVVPVDEQPAIVIAIGRLLSKIAPKTGLIGLDANLVSRDRNVVDAYVADPLVNKGKISARLAAEMLGAMQRAQDNAGSLTLPILLLHGGDDGLTAVAGSKLLHEAARSKDKTLKIYEGFYHEIFNDPGKETVIKDMVDWLDAHA